MGVQKIDLVETGVDVAYFAPPETRRVEGRFGVCRFDGLAPQYRRRQVSSPNRFCPGFARIGRHARWRSKADVRVRVIEELGARDPNIVGTGTVPDVRPWLWGSAISIVPLRIGEEHGSKIFEAMAAKVPGRILDEPFRAEGLPVEPGRHLTVADDAEAFAQSCLKLLDDHERRRS